MTPVVHVSRPGQPSPHPEERPSGRVSKDWRERPISRHGDIRDAYTGVMRFFPIILLLLVGCAAPLPVPPYEAPPPTPTGDLNSVDWLGPKPTPDDLEIYVSNFRKLAFRTERHGHHPYVKKWSGTLVCSSERERFHVYVERTLSKLKVATGLDFQMGYPLQRGCPISFYDEQDFNGCNLAPLADQKAYTHFVVRIGKWPWLSECIEEELSQLMGFYNDIRYPHSMWNDGNNGTVNRLTWHDAVMLRVLYHAELYQGMPEAEAMRIVPGLMRKVILEIQ
jgi:hypothetical protein